MAIVKFVSSGCTMNNIFKYVTRDEATEEKLISGVNCSPDTAMQEFKFVKQQSWSHGRSPSFRQLPDS